eukprot:jgi/Chlat1/5375/Chrsp35S05290
MNLCLRPALALLVSVLLLASWTPCFRAQSTRPSALFEQVHAWVRNDQPFLNFISKSVSRVPQQQTSAFLRAAGRLALDGLQTNSTSSTGALLTYRTQLELIQANANAARDRPLALAINATLQAASALTEANNEGSTARPLATSLLFNALYDFVYRGNIVAAAANVLTPSSLLERVQAADAYCHHSRTALPTDACLDSYLSVMFTARQFALTVLKYTRVISNQYCVVRALDEGFQRAYAGLLPEISTVDTIKTYLTRAVNMKDLDDLSTSCFYQAGYTRVCTSCWYSEPPLEDTHAATSQPHRSRGQPLLRWYALPLVLGFLVLSAVVIAIVLQLLARKAQRQAAQRARNNPTLEDAAVVAEGVSVLSTEIEWCIMVMPDGEEVVAIVDTSHVKKTTTDVAGNNAFDLRLDRLSLSSLHSERSPHSAEQPVCSGGSVAPVRLFLSNDAQGRDRQGSEPIELVFVVR